MKKLSSLQVSIFLTELSHLISGGHPPIEALEMIGRQTPNPTLAGHLHQASLALKGGATFAEALARPGHPFPARIVRFFKFISPDSSQWTADLKTLGRQNRLLIDSPVRENFFKTVFSDSGRFVLFLTLFFVVQYLVVGPVVHAFSKMFFSFGGYLPHLTQLVINVSNFYIRHPFVSFAFFSVLWFIILYFLYIYSLKTIGIYQMFQYLFEQMKLGGTFERALDLAIEIQDNGFLRKKFEQVKMHMKEGLTPGQAFDLVKFFPVVISRNLFWAEDLDHLKIGVDKLRLIFERRSPRNLFLIFEIFLGIIFVFIVGVSVVSMYLPIFSMASVIQ